MTNLEQKVADQHLADALAFAEAAKHEIYHDLPALVIGTRACWLVHSLCIALTHDENEVTQLVDTARRCYEAYTERHAKAEARKAAKV